MSASIPWPSPELSKLEDYCVRCGHHRNRHNAGCGCTAYRAPTGDMVADYVRGDFCQCVAFVEREAVA
jgi:hypothetical protein